MWNKFYWTTKSIPKQLSHQMNCRSPQKNLKWASTPPIQT